MRDPPRWFLSAATSRAPRSPARREQRGGLELQSTVVDPVEYEVCARIEHHTERADQRERGPDPAADQRGAGIEIGADIGVHVEHEPRPRGGAFVEDARGHQAAM